MTKITNLVKETVRKEMEIGGFRGAHRVEQISDRPHISGGIELPNLDTIVIGYNPEYEKIRPDMLSVMAQDVARHEQNHRVYRGFNGCPRNIDYHTEKIIEPIAKVLTPKGFAKSDVKYLANTLEDSILHSDLNARFSLTGISEFFSDVGRSADGARLTPFYDAHVKLNLYLWGNGKQRKQLRPYAVKDKDKQKEIAQVVQNFINRTGLGGLEQEIELNGKPVKIKDRKKIRNFLNDEKNWEKVSQIYAEEFSKLMGQSYAMPNFNHSGRGTKGRETEMPLPTDGNEFDEAMEREEYKSQRVQKAFTKDSGIPPLIESYESKDIVYQMLAKKLNLRVKTFTESDKRPVAWYGRKDFDPERDKAKHLVFDLDEHGDAVLKRRPYSQTMNIPHKQSQQGFPEARFCLLDTSGSMQLDPEGGNNTGKKSIIPWGDNSRYHFALLSWYGFLEYLKQNHLLSQTTVSLGNFSEKTIISKGLQEAKKNALSPQFRRTVIEPQKVNDIFAGNQRALIYTISDGEIENWEDIKTDFLSGAKNHSYFHMQIGPDTEMSQDLKGADFEVVSIRRVEDLAQKVIDVTDSIYRGVNQQ